MSYYQVKYKLKDYWDEKVWSWKEVTYEIIRELVTQIWKWVGSINWDIITGLKSLEKFQILEVDFLYEEWGEHFVPVWKAVVNGIPNMDHYESLEHIHGFVDELDDYKPSIVDITNKVFTECGLTFNDSQRIEMIWDILHVWGKMFDLDSTTKIRDIFDILCRVRGYYDSLEITYEQMEELYKKKEYKNLRIQDINATSIRDLIKNKLPSMNKQLDLWAKESFVSVKVDKVIFSF